MIVIIIKLSEHSPAYHLRTTQHNGTILANVCICARSWCVLIHTDQRHKVDLIVAPIAPTPSRMNTYVIV